MSYRLGILVSHPVQYLAPWFRYLAERMDVQVFYAYRQTPAGQSAAGFGVEFSWDIPLLTGYPWRWLTNVARRPSLQTFSGCDTPEIYEIVRRERFDAFMVFGWNWKAALQTVFACWRRHIPVLMRGDSQLITPRSRMRLALKHGPYRWFLPRLEAHLCVGQRNRDYLRHYGVADRQIFFVPHCVDTNFFSIGAHQAESDQVPKAIRARLGIPQDAFVFLFVGKMIARKRPGDFLEACRRIGELPQDRPIHGLLVGDGVLRQSLEANAYSRTDRLHFAGFQNQRELPAFYRAADALVLPSEGNETWGLVVNEAFACGLPAVVSDACGCAPDLIDAGKTGEIFSLGNIAQLSERMLAVKALAEGQPAPMRAALAEKTRRYSMAAAAAGLGRALISVTAQPFSSHDRGKASL